MKRDDAMRRIQELLNSEELARVLEERERAESTVPAKPPRKRRTSASRAGTWVAPRAASIEDLLERFTPEEAFLFIYRHTVPPADEDGLALLAAYPELEAAAPALVRDMAVCFRVKARDQYAAYFELVAKHHGIEVQL